MFVLNRFFFACLLVLPWTAAAEETPELKAVPSVNPAGAEPAEPTAAPISQPVAPIAPPAPAAAASASAAALSTGALAKSVRPCLVAVYPSGREGTESGIGSGFVISEDGLIATQCNLPGNLPTHHQSRPTRHWPKPH